MNVIVFYVARRLLGVVALWMQWRDDRRVARREVRRAARIAATRRITPQVGASTTPPVLGRQKPAQEVQ